MELIVSFRIIKYEYDHNNMPTEAYNTTTSYHTRQFGIHFSNVLQMSFLGVIYSVQNIIKLMNFAFCVQTNFSLVIENDETDHDL